MLTDVSFDKPQPSGQPPTPQARCPANRRPEDPRRTLGRRGELMAAAHLQRLGFKIVARNVRTRQGEIDLIACDGETLAFVEVKTRRAHRHRRQAPEEQPLAWLRTRQRTRLRRLATAWLQEQRGEHRAVRTIRFDAIGVIIDEDDGLLCLDHIAGAW
jgi:putative endonuclease